MNFVSKALVGKIVATVTLVFFATAVNGFGQGPTRQASQSQQTNSTATSTEGEQKAIEDIIRNYLLKNPIVIREALKALQIQEQKDKEERTANLIKELRSEILSDPNSPIGGNRDGDVSIVVFFDYNCGYCKQTLPQLQSILENDPLVRVVFKEFPVLGPQSWFAAKAALAAARQGKYVEFHNALMTAENTDEDSITSVSKTLGIDYTKLQKDMADPQIDEQLARVQRLAGTLDINGTPSYIVGDRIIPGAIDAESLTRFVMLERKNVEDAISTKSGVDEQ
jgi:protein-disulfide isomerase